MLFLAMPGSEDLASKLAELCTAESAVVEVRRFPDGEDYVRVRAEVAGRKVYLVSCLSFPGAKILPLVFAARTVRILGASRVTLVAPYLPYLRQDQVFHDGEALTSKIFADLIGREFDALMTVDPHLHRYHSLDQVYRIPAKALSSVGLIGGWVRDNVAKPVILGPDDESRQWAERVAAMAGAPWTIFQKRRLGDRQVGLSAPRLSEWRGHIPVLIDDIIASGTTMIEACRAVTEAGLPAPICIGIHGLFDRRAGNRLERLARLVLTTDTVLNPYSHFEMAPEFARAIDAVENQKAPAQAD